VKNITLRCICQYLERLIALNAQGLVSYDACDAGDVDESQVVTLAKELP
jgi:hypothetical protein